MEEQKFSEKINDTIVGPPKKRVTITFPQEVFDDFDNYAKENSADCYWLAIKQLMDFFKEQKSGDLRTAMIMQSLTEFKADVEELKEKIHKLEAPKEESFQTFGKNEKEE